MIVVRPVALHEHGALGRLTVAAYRALGHVDPGYEDELADIAAKVDGAEVFVAVDDEGRGPVLGGVCYVAGPSSPYAEFTGEDEAGFRHLAVDPQRGGRGAGRALVGACIARARADGKRRIVIHSTPAMTRAHAIYARYGFVREPAIDWQPNELVQLWGFVLDLGED